MPSLLIELLMSSAHWNVKQNRWRLKEGGRHETEIDKMTAITQGPKTGPCDSLAPRVSWVIYFICWWALLSLRGNRNPWDGRVFWDFTWGQCADMHSEILTLLRETGYPCLVSIPVITWGFFKKITVPRWIRQIGNCVLGRNTPDLKSSWDVEDWEGFLPLLLFAFCFFTPWYAAWWFQAKK